MFRVWPVWVKSQPQSTLAPPPANEMKPKFFFSEMPAVKTKSPETKKKGGRPISTAGTTKEAN